jgi:hypothetical protein
MARRPEFSEKPMSTEELREFQRRNALLSPSTVEERLARSWERCRPARGSLPGPRVMQEFVALWKLMWKWKK